LTAARNQLRRGANVLAVELHQQTAHDTDLVWDAELTCAVPIGGGGMPIRIISFEMVAPNFSLVWSAVSGEAYRVQTSADLITWTNIGEVIIASGTSARAIKSGVTFGFALRRPTAESGFQQRCPTRWRR
jgi:hypothetical protein